MAAFGLAIFTGAFLLFQVQPLIAKYLLPWFGGAPGVWTTCMLFFQVLLLAGYAYAHLSARLLRIPAQVGLHLALIGVSLLSLPIIPDPAWRPGASDDPTFAIIGLLAVSLGLPYFTLSATAPLLQHWFSRTRPEVSPFRLYALSNAGSLLALLSYPAVVEPWIPRSSQAFLWGAGLALYAAACAWVATRVWKARHTAPATVGSDPATPSRTPPSQTLLWVLLPACASVLLLAVTNKICQDVAVIPFLWILPLTLYLLSFIVCFEKPAWYRRGPFAAALLLSLAAAVYALFAHNSLTPPIQIAIYTAALFICCMVCHGEVYRLRPAPAHLTAFYLLLACGGALGGLFVGLVAPRWFSDYYELHLGLWGCAALLLAVRAREQRERQTAAWPRPAWAVALALCLGLGAALAAEAARNRGHLAHRDRSFYGVLSVFEYPASTSGSVRELVHGRIAHGVQVVAPGQPPQPTMYYTHDSGVGRALSLIPPGDRHLGLVGLGAGTLAAFGQTGDRIRFYEINPEVETVARRHFTFLSQSQADSRVILGDARRSLEAEPPQAFDLLALDAFSGDAVPLHLLTREAFAAYDRHLKPNAIVAVHVSNLSLNLEPAVVRVGQEFGLHPVVIENRQKPGDAYVQNSTWVLLFRNPEMTNAVPVRFASRPAWPTSFPVPLWTDDFAALFPVLRWEQAWRLHSPAPERLVQTADEFMDSGRTADAIAAYEKALRLPAPSPGVMNNLAWIRAATPEPELRRGPEAVRLAQMACGLTLYQDILFVGTLAAAYAEAGNFDEAVRTAQIACSLAAQRGEAQLLARNTELLELYRRRVTVAQNQAGVRSAR